MKKMTEKSLPYFLMLTLAVTIILFVGSRNSMVSTEVTSSEIDQPILSSSEISDAATLDSKDEPQPAMPVFSSWKTYTVNDGLPSDKANCVKIDGNRVLVGTDKGLAIFENNQWTTYDKEDGLTHNNVLFIDVNDATGDVWLATMAGLTRWSSGKFSRYTQFNSGLANDVVYQVDCNDRYVWAATGAGASMLDTYTNQWKILNEQNAPMHEPWTYGVNIGKVNIYIAAWGGGVIEYNNETGRFRDYRDPDHEMEIDLFPDDGIVHDITTSVWEDEGILWVGTYFGLSRYDGMRWNSYFDHDSGLASNFINFLKADNSIAYICTDKGLSTFNGTAWVTYTNSDNSSKGIITIKNGKDSEIRSSETSMAHNYIWGADVRGDEIWVATAQGVSYAKASGKIKTEKDKM